MNEERLGNGSKWCRRNFLGVSLGLGASASLMRRAESGVIRATSSGTTEPEGFASTGDVEERLSKIDRMEVLGFPRNWAVVHDGFHPFAPERVEVWPSGSRLNFDRCDSTLRREIDRKIEELWADSSSQGYPIPGEKRESFYQMIDRWTGYYDRPDLFEPWVLGLAGREALGSSWMGKHCGLVHQYGSTESVRVDCPPVDWWLFLFPQGIDWASLTDQPTYTLLGHVSRSPWWKGFTPMYRVWGLTQSLVGVVEDWPRVSRMGRVDAARYLNRTIVSILGEERL